MRLSEQRSLRGLRLTEIAKETASAGRVACLLGLLRLSTSEQATTSSEQAARLGLVVLLLVGLIVLRSEEASTAGGAGVTKEGARLGRLLLVLGCRSKKTASRAGRCGLGSKQTTSAGRVAKQSTASCGLLGVLLLIVLSKQSAAGVIGLGVVGAKEAAGACWLLRVVLTEACDVSV